MPKYEVYRREYDECTGKQRHILYKAAIEKANLAIENCFFIEAISIYESLLADRLEARLSIILGNQVEINTVSSNARKLIEKEKTILNEHLEAKKIYELIIKWSRKRNKAIHQIAKLVVSDKNASFEQRYSEYQQVAVEGKTLFYKLISIIEKIRKKEMTMQI